MIFFALISKSLGWDWYNSANGAFWNYTWGYTETPPPLPFWPYPALFAAFMVKSKVVMFLVIALMSLWWQHRLLILAFTAIFVGYLTVWLPGPGAFPPGVVVLQIAPLDFFRCSMVCRVQ